MTPAQQYKTCTTRSILPVHIYPLPVLVEMSEEESIAGTAKRRAPSALTLGPKKKPSALLVFLLVQTRNLLTR